MEIDIQALRSAKVEEKVNIEELFKIIKEEVLKLYLKQPGAMENAKVDIDMTTGQLKIIACVKNDDGEIIEEFDDTPTNFDRFVMPTIKTIIKQKIYENFDNKIIETYKYKKGSLITGIIQQSGENNPNILVNIGDVEAVIPPQEQVPSEKYKHGDRIQAYVVDVMRGHKGPRIILSRTHPELVREIFKLEVPDIQEGLVEIVSIAREAGYRTKVAVKATAPKINATGTCIGPMSNRINSVIKHLQGEKIDIIDYSHDDAKYIANALAPARVSSVLIEDEQERRAKVIVPDFQLSLAIGKQAQNVRLAARLTGWKIDITSDVEQTGQIQTSHEQQKDRVQEEYI